MTTVVLCLLACDPLPPCAATLRGWLQRAAFADVPEDAPNRIDRRIL